MYLLTIKYLNTVAHMIRWSMKICKYIVTILLILIFTEKKRMKANSICYAVASAFVLY